MLILVCFGSGMRERSSCSHLCRSESAATATLRWEETFPCAIHDPNVRRRSLGVTGGMPS